MLSYFLRSYLTSIHSGKKFQAGHELNSGHAKIIDETRPVLT